MPSEPPVQAGRVCEHGQDLIARRGRGDPPRVHSEEAGAGEVNIVLHDLEDAYLAPIQPILVARRG
ncbi:MAG: hypothetical protein WCI75_14475, partial [candidate division NC10 bacterium]